MAAPDEVDDEQPKKSIWPHVEERVFDLVAAHRSTIVFTNARRLAERLTNRLNEIGFERGRETEIARAHHGSVSREQRTITEELLKSGQLPAVVATSSLELGIDMGAVDLVVQVESPPSVASGLQRIGRAGHQVGAVSRGVVFPKYRGDLVQTAVVTERMKEGAIEAIKVPQNPLDVLAQQLVSMVAMEQWDVDDALALVRRAAVTFVVLSVSTCAFVAPQVTSTASAASPSATQVTTVHAKAKTTKKAAAKKAAKAKAAKAKAAKAATAKAAAAKTASAIVAKASATAVPTTLTVATGRVWAQTMLTLLNAERAAHLLPPLTMNSMLISSAHQHNLAMAAADTMSHQLPHEAYFAVRISRAGYDWQAAGENILFLAPLFHFHISRPVASSNA